MQSTYPGDELNRIERVAHNRTGLWAAIAITLLGLLIFTGIFNFVLPDFGAEMQGVGLVIWGLIFSLIPAALWLFLFYRLDRLEAEPKHMVLKVFVLGALVAGALYAPLVNGLFGFRDWQYSAWWAHLLGGILIVGIIEQYLIYLTVRFSVFAHPEFDERVDGVIYAVAAGLGVATVHNLNYVVAGNGVDLDIGSIRMVVNALAYASFAGVLGYFIGQMRFEKVPIYYMPMGLLIAAVLNGLFFFLLDRTLGGGLNYNPWNDLIFAAIIAMITLAIVFWLVERANEETLRLMRPPAASEPDLGMIGAPGLAPAAAESAPPVVPGVEVYDTGPESPGSAAAGPEATGSETDSSIADSSAPEEKP